MEPKNRLLIAITVIVLIVAAMFTSFGRNLFALNTPSVVLPNVNGDGQTGDVSGPQTGLERYQAVELSLIHIFRAPEPEHHAPSPFPVPHFSL